MAVAHNRYAVVEIGLRLLLRYNLCNGTYANDFDIDNSSGVCNTAKGDVSEGTNEIEAAVAQDLAQAVVFNEHFGPVLKETVFYCLAEKLGLKNLKQQSLLNHGPLSSIPPDIVVASARYPYDHFKGPNSMLYLRYRSHIIDNLDGWIGKKSIMARITAGSNFTLDLISAMF